jgi:hypothetical protein
MKKIILAAALAAPFALGTAAFAQEAGGFAGAPVNDIVTAPRTASTAAPREFVGRANGLRQDVPVTSAERVQIDRQVVPSSTGGKN